MSRHQISIANHDCQFVCAEQETLLHGIDRQREKAIQIGCRGGGCGVCKIRILVGDYECKKMSIKHVTAQELAEGFALSCRVYPRSDMVIEVIDQSTQG